MTQPPTQIPPHARCWQCGYLLRDIPARRCPECGKPFNPDDPASMNLTGKHRGLIHYLLTRPIGYVAVTFAAISTLLIAIITRLPARLANLDFSFLDVRIVLTPQNWPVFYRIPYSRTWVDFVLLAALALWIVTLLAIIPRTLARAFLRRRHREAFIKTPRRRWAILAGLFLLTFILLPLGQDFRLAHHWLAPYETHYPIPFTSSYRSPYLWHAGSAPDPYPSLSAERHLEILHTAILRLPSPVHRTIAAKVLVEARTAEALPLLLDALPRESNPAARVTLLHLVALYRNPASVPLIAVDLTHSDPSVRAAAIDALGIIHAPAYDIPLNGLAFFGRPEPYIIASPPIALLDLISYSVDPSGRRRSRNADDRIINTPVPLPDSLRAQLEFLMLSAPTPEERLAAARALIRWPPQNYKLRVTEWGVWIADSNSNLTLVRSLVDEIPPFVHRTGNPTSDFDGRINQIMIIDKPVIHITTDQPLALDVEVHIHRGRPWFAYPIPDDFEFVTQTHFIGSTAPAPLAGLEPPPGFPKLAVLNTGYPWISPHHRQHGSISGGMGDDKNEIIELGIHWQSLIITPQPPNTPHPLPADPRYNWWARLRRVPSSYVTSHDETERFLYYDGPTKLPLPLVITRVARGLQFFAPRFDEPANYGDIFASLKTQPLAPRRGLFIRVRDHLASAAVITPPDLIPEGILGSNTRPHAFEIAIPPLSPNAPAQLLKLLTDSGLTPEESAGLIDAWTPQFFHTDGDRFLLLMSSADYDNFCPLAITPAPTTLVRTGIILTEFGPP